jgi:hypothetical protein
VRPKKGSFFSSFLALGTTNSTICEMNLQGADCVRRILTARDLLALSESSSIFRCFAQFQSENPVRLPRLEGRRYARRRRRAPPHRWGCAVGSQSRPLAADGAAHLGAAGDVGHDARLHLVVHRPRNASIEAQVSLWLRHGQAPRMLCTLLAAAYARQPQASGSGDRSRGKSEPRDVNRGERVDDSGWIREWARARARPTASTTTASSSSTTTASTTTTTASTAASARTVVERRFPLEYAAYGLRNSRLCPHGVHSSAWQLPDCLERLRGGSLRGH